MRGVHFYLAVVDDGRSSHTCANDSIVVGKNSLGQEDVSDALKSGHRAERHPHGDDDMSSRCIPPLNRLSRGARLRKGTHPRTHGQYSLAVDLSKIEVLLPTLATTSAKREPSLSSDKLEG